jgi:hypothetical protein
VDHDDLRGWPTSVMKLIQIGLLPPQMAGSSVQHLRQTPEEANNARPTLDAYPSVSSGPTRFSNPFEDEESRLGVSPSKGGLAHWRSLQSESHSPFSNISHRSRKCDTGSPIRAAMRSRPQAITRRPAAVRVIAPESHRVEDGSGARSRQAKVGERTPLIKPGVTPDWRKSVDDAKSSARVCMRAEIGLGRMAELGLPLIMWVIWIMLHQI